jgi:anti-sigma B factor antagonist
LTGRLDAHQVPRLRSQLEPGKENLTLDFSGINFIDSTGLAMLISLYKETRASKRELRITNLQDQVRLIFEITRLYSVLPIEE